MQKFHRGDHVRIAKNLGTGRSHFESDCEAIILYSYQEQYGDYDGADQEYHVYIRKVGEVSWYNEHQLTLIKKKDLALLSKWKKEMDREEP